MMWGPSVLYSLRFIAFTLFFIYVALFSIFYLISPLLCTFVHYFIFCKPQPDPRVSVLQVPKELYIE